MKGLAFFGPDKLRARMLDQGVDEVLERTYFDEDEQRDMPEFSRPLNDNFLPFIGNTFLQDLPLMYGESASKGIVAWGSSDTAGDSVCADTACEALRDAYSKGADGGVRAGIRRRARETIDNVEQGINERFAPALARAGVDGPLLPTGSLYGGLRKPDAALGILLDAIDSLVSHELETWLRNFCDAVVQALKSHPQFPDPDAGFFASLVQPTRASFMSSASEAVGELVGDDAQSTADALKEAGKTFYEGFMINSMLLIAEAIQTRKTTLLGELIVEDVLDGDEEDEQAPDEKAA